MKLSRGSYAKWLLIYRLTPQIQTMLIWHFRKSNQVFMKIASLKNICILKQNYLFNNIITTNNNSKWILINHSIKRMTVTAASDLHRATVNSWVKYCVSRGCGLDRRHFNNSKLAAPGNLSPVKPYSQRPKLIALLYFSLFFG